MDSNGCDTNHLDARLPPRKRLLAGLKKQSFSESTSQCSQENTPSPSLSPSIVQSPLSEFDIRLSNLLRSYKNGSNMSPEEIALAAKSAAETAAKAAEVARAVAEEKAAIAAKAVAAAKSALDLVPYEETSRRDKHYKKKKLKNHMPVQLLDEEYQSTENCGADEELARRLHRSMNSSPRILKPSSGSSSRSHKHKKLKMSLPNDKSGVSNGDAEGGMVCEGSIEEEAFTGKEDEKESEFSKNNEGDVDSSEAESIHPKEKTVDGFNDLSISGRRRGRIRRKKLPLNICSSKDQANSKEESKSTNPSSARARTEQSAAHQLALLSMEPCADNITPMELEVAPTWKCQDFKVSQCIKQEKLVQS
ncbi:hypothetical protein vseg_015620 [Gypsophila vaccaria]